MNETDIFSALHKYFPRADKPPEENQITEMLSQVLKHEIGFARHIFTKWFPKAPPLSDPSFRTQVPIRIAYDSASQTKYLDLVVYDSAQDSTQLAFVIEIKWWADESFSLDPDGNSVPQTASYDRFVDNLDPRERYVGRLFLTRRRKSSPGEWLHRRWCDLLAEARVYLSSKSREPESFGTRLLTEFVSFLVNEDIEEESMNFSDIASISKTMEVCRKVESIFKQVQPIMKEVLRDTVAAKSFGNQLLEQIVNQDRIALYWYGYKSLHVVCGIYPSAEVFERQQILSIEQIRGVPLITTLVIADVGILF